MMAGYWAERQHYSYYAAIQQMLTDCGSQQSLLDIGSMDTPVATWGNFATRYTIDPRPRNPLPHVTAVVGSWPDDLELLPSRLSVITCLQVIEHVENTRRMCDAMFAAATNCVIISVPYEWPAKACHYHVHDPIDEAKLVRLVGRVPDESVIVNDDGWRRVIARYGIEVAA